MEDIKLLVQEEGRSARNLVAFNVPVILTQCDSNSGKVMKKPPTSPRSLSELKKDETRCKRSRDSSQSGSRVRSASTGRDKKSDSKQFHCTKIYVWHIYSHIKQATIENQRCQQYKAIVSF